MGVEVVIATVSVSVVVSVISVSLASVTDTGGVPVIVSDCLVVPVTIVVSEFAPVTDSVVLVVVTTTAVAVVVSPFGPFGGFIVVT